MKTRAILVFSLLAFSLSTCAQQVSPNDYMYYSRYRTFGFSAYNHSFRLPVKYNKRADYLKEKGISQFTTTSYKYKKNGNHKGDKFYRVYKFNEDGKVISDAGGRIGKPISWTTTYQYNDKGMLSRVESFDNKGELTEIQQSNYYKDKSGYFDYVKINKKGDTTIYKIRNPRDTIRQSSYDYYYKNGKLKYTWFNEYHPDGQSKRTTATNGREKVKYVWNFECKENGVEQKKHKDTSTTCVSREYDKDSILTVVNMSVNEKGTMFKTVNKYNKQKKLIYRLRRNETKNQMIYEGKYRFAADGVTSVSLETSNYYKGLLNGQNFNTYDEEGNLLSSVHKNYRKGALDNTRTLSYEYDAKHRPLLCKTLLENGKPISVLKYSYN